MTTDEQVRDAFTDVGNAPLDEDAAWQSITGRLGTGRPRWRVGVAAAAAVVVLMIAGGVIWVAGDGDPAQVTTGTNAPETPARSETTVTLLREQEQPSPNAEPEFSRVITQVMVFGGANPPDNEALVLSFVEILESEGFRNELAADTGVPAAEFEIVACRPAASALLNVEVHASSATAWLLAKQVTPTTRRIIERILPPDFRPPGPIITELSIQGGQPVYADGDEPCGD